MTLNNYEKTLLKAEQEFLSFNQDDIIKYAGIKYDNNYFYISFCSSPYCVDRDTGKCLRIGEKGELFPAAYNEAMPIFDIICNPKPFRCLTGEFTDHSYFTATPFADRGLYAREAELFACDLEGFKRACVSLKGTPFPGNADAAYKIPLFDFFPVVLKVCLGEEGIAPVFTHLWDKAAMTYMTYESTYIALTHLLNCIKELMKED